MNHLIKIDFGRNEFAIKHLLVVCFDGSSDDLRIFFWKASNSFASRPVNSRNPQNRSALITLHFGRQPKEPLRRTAFFEDQKLELTDSRFWSTNCWMELSSQDRRSFGTLKFTEWTVRLRTGRCDWSPSTSPSFGQSGIHCVSVKSFLVHCNFHSAGCAAAHYYRVSFKKAPSSFTYAELLLT